MIYKVTLLTINGDEISTYDHQDVTDVNCIIANTLTEGYPLPEFNGIAQELNEHMDILIEEQDNEPTEGCGYDAALDQKLN
jgi:hypothetical protein